MVMGASCVRLAVLWKFAILMVFPVTGTPRLLPELTGTMPPSRYSCENFTVVLSEMPNSVATCRIERNPALARTIADGVR